MDETVFRLRVNFQKRDRLRFLSHPELVRALERMVRRAQLPFAVSRGQEGSLRLVPGSALPAGTVGLDEYFDLWLTEYLKPARACERLRQASVRGLEIRSASYADPRARGLQATHTREVYEVVLSTAAAEGLSAAELSERLGCLVAGGSLAVARKGKKKVYDLTQAVERMPVVREVDDDDGSGSDGPNGPSSRDSSGCDPGDPGGHGAVITLWLRVTEQGAIRPTALVSAALDGLVGWELRSVTRTRLYEGKGGGER